MRSGESRRSNADDADSAAVYSIRLANDSWVACKGSLPVSVGDDGRQRSIDPIVIRREQSTCCRRQSHRVEERASHKGALRPANVVWWTGVERKRAESADAIEHIPLVGKRTHHRVRE